MSFESFIQDSGLKVLAMARLNQCEYAIMLYLLNCSVSGLEELITNKKELSSLIGYEEKILDKCIEALEKRKLITVRYGEKHQSGVERQSLRIGVQYDMNKWEMEFDEGVTSNDAIVFPFVRGKNLQLVADSRDTIKSDAATINKALPTWKRVLNSYLEHRTLSPEKVKKSTEEAKILIQTHPVDQVLLMLRHFGERIPTLSLLASSWQHYQELFELENQKVDLMGARQKHVEQDCRLRDTVQVMLDRKEELGLSEEETAVLEIIYNHNHPRRQLFWAYQTRGRYPNLKCFFKENEKQMLPVTSSGNVFKKKPHQDS